jgi:phosphohistidine phosphatase SixA
LNHADGSEQQSSHYDANRALSGGGKQEMEASASVDAAAISKTALSSLTSLVSWDE